MCEPKVHREVLFVNRLFDDGGVAQRHPFWYGYVKCAYFEDVVQSFVDEFFVINVGCHFQAQHWVDVLNELVLGGECPAAVEVSGITLGPLE